MTATRTRKPRRTAHVATPMKSAAREIVDHYIAAVGRPDLHRFAAVAPVAALLEQGVSSAALQGAADAYGHACRAVGHPPEAPAAFYAEDGPWKNYADSETAPATPEQARVYRLWADAIRTSLAAIAALDEFCHGVDAGIGISNADENYLHRTSDHLAGSLRIGVESCLDNADLPEEVHFLLGRFDAPGKHFRNTPEGEFGRTKALARMRQRFGDLDPAREVA